MIFQTPLTKGPSSQPTRKVRRVVSAEKMDSIVSMDGRCVKYVTTPQGAHVEVIRNPTPRDTAQMAKEAKAAYPHTRKATLEEQIRYTTDGRGNCYAWKAYEAAHYDIEAAIARAYSFELEVKR